MRAHVGSASPYAAITPRTYPLRTANLLHRHAWGKVETPNGHFREAQLLVVLT
jgi:hypothetical protein